MEDIQIPQISTTKKVGVIIQSESNETTQNKERC